MIDKICPSAGEALAGLIDGATVLIGGFGDAGSPVALIQALLDQGTRELTVVTNNAGGGTIGLIELLRERRIRKLVCSYPRSFDNTVFADLYRAKEIELELVPQGTLAERIRAGGAGIPAFYTPTGAHSEIRAGNEKRDFAGVTHVLEHAIKGDIALIKADCGDRWGNLRYYKAARNFGPVMATAAATVVAQVGQIVPLGDLDPESIVTPGIFVDHVVLAHHTRIQERAA